MASKEFRFAQDQGIQIRVELFNITNRLNYENPAAALPAGTIGLPFTDAVAGTFGYMLGPLNRTVGLGTARQTQLAILLPVLAQRRSHGATDRAPCDLPRAWILRLCNIRVTGRKSSPPILN